MAKQSLIVIISNKMFALLQTFLYIYLILKLHLANNFKITTNPLLRTWITLTLLLFSSLITPLAILFYIIMKIYKTTIVMILKYKLGDDFDDVLDGTDMVFTLEEHPSQQIVNSVAVVDYPNDDFYQCAKALAFERINGKKIRRMFSVRDTFMGYVYLRRVPFNIDEHIREVDLTENEFATMEEFKIALSKLSNQPLPKNNKATWEVLVGKQPVQWNSSKKQRIFLFRVHHSVGDGVCLYSILVGLFGDIGEKQLMPDCLKSNAPVSSESKVVNDITYYFDTLLTMVDRISGLRLKYRGCRDYQPENLLHGPSLTGKKNISWMVEESEKYVQKVKDIKNRIPNTIFTNVLFTAVSASLAQFYQKKGQDLPDYIQSSLVIHTKSEELGFYETGNLELLDIGNKFLWAIIDLPIIEKTKKHLPIDSYLISRLDNIKLEFNELKQSMDLQLNNFMSTVLIDVLTVKMIGPLIATNKPTISISNLPGNRQLTCLGHKVTDILFWTPHIKNLGIGLSIMTYASRFQVGILVDDAILSDFDDIQSIADGVIHYIDVLDEKTKNLF